MDFKNINIGENIVRMRKIHKMSQLQLAEIIGKSQSAVSAYEHGETLPPFDVLLMIASALDVDIGMIMGLESKSPALADLRMLYEMYLNDEKE